MVMRECSTHRLLLATVTFWVLLGGWTDIPVHMLLDRLPRRLTVADLYGSDTF